MQTEAPGISRHASGLKLLDQILQGGVPQGSMVLVIGLPGTGKSTLGKQFLLTAVSKREPAILLSTAEPDQIILESTKQLGLDFRAVEKIRLIDCYSWRAGFKNVPDIRNLTEVNSAIDGLLSILHNAAGSILVIDSFTDFLLNNSADTVVSFISQLKMSLQMRGVTTLLLLESGPHDSRLESTIEFIADGTIQTKLDESGRFLMVRRMLATPVQPRWIPFTLTKTVDAVLKDFFGSKE
ncbi:MAG TPA: RAD55 family ATPase [Candidatus Acidoferrales bacterium]|nr:RAD55 family ATPase [Candidatus Acidoferrales bacterium]